MDEIDNKQEKNDKGITGNAVKQENIDAFTECIMLAVDAGYSAHKDGIDIDRIKELMKEQIMSKIIEKRNTNGKHDETLIKLDIDIIDPGMDSLSVKAYELKKRCLQDSIERISLVNTLLNLDVSKVDVRETTKGYHLRMAVPFALCDMCILLIQSLMGDDYKRGCMNFKRAKRGEKDWNVLFNRKWGKHNNIKSQEVDKGVVTFVEGELLDKAILDSLKGMFGDRNV